MEHFNTSTTAPLHDQHTVSTAARVVVVVLLHDVVVLTQFLVILKYCADSLQSGGHSSDMYSWKELGWGSSHMLAVNRKLLPYGLASRNYCCRGQLPAHGHAVS